MNSPTSSSPERRERLFDAAAKLFVRWGFDKTSVEDIAREAGVSKGAVYLEFPTKDALFKALLYRESLQYSDEWLRRFQADAREWSFAVMFEHSIAAIHGNPFMKALVTRDAAFFGTYLQRDRELFEMRVSIGVELFGRLQAAGAMRGDIPAPVLAFITGAMSFGLMVGNEHLPAGAQVSFEEGVGALGLLLDRGLAPEHRGNPEAARAILVDVVEKTQAALRKAKAPAPRRKKS